MTTYVYEVRSDVPLGLTRIAGNTAAVLPHATYTALTVRDQMQTCNCGPQCAPAHLTIELKERVEP